MSCPMAAVLCRIWKTESEFPMWQNLHLLINIFQFVLNFLKGMEEDAILSRLIRYMILTSEVEFYG